MILPILFAFSNLIFLTLLIRTTLKGDSDQRFIIKLLACLHYLVLAFWAFWTVKTTPHEVWILIGLIFAFLGDATLGLKHRAAWMMPGGLFFFLLTQWAYTLSFGISGLSLGVSGCFLVLMLPVAIRMKKNPAYDFKGLDLGVLIYALSMLMMLSSAWSAFMTGLQPVDFLKAIGALVFVISDVTLLQLYFHKPKKTRMVLVYLIFYHLGQSLIALSLWF